MIVFVALLITAFVIVGLLAFPAAAPFVADVPSVVVGGVVERLWECFPLAVSAPKTHRTDNEPSD
ncbi:hypothetical protein OHB05_42625 [Streptomyces sp. NBC_00638]|uniref:hypothetical protein n=1 Tax=Streptomyces sp. NBC_00638 TaxID=2975794 RepID=UPI002253904A|nr:hypothetical protein [Streptomyces sp. NBC_00638]MCX5009213.1 hypothetical protein [Streptomyces sp. NBC_00638]